MAEILVMPKLGLTMEEGFLDSWLCEPGTAVALGQPICEVETDKLTVTVESPFAGMLLRCIEAGGTVPVGAPIAVIGEPGEDTATYCLYQPGGGETTGSPVTASPHQHVTPPGPAPARQTAPPQPAAPPELPTPAGAPAASPLARRIAATLDIDLAAVDGTGPEGRITREDVERAAAALGRARPNHEGGPR